jgi:MinD-like ATPase involved in chromosome partitioning or flagellar assembly
LKIKLAILDHDKAYLDRLVQSFTGKYSDKIEVYSFTDEALALSSLTDRRVNIFVAGMDFDVKMSKIPSKCGFAYFTDLQDAESYKEQKTIFKYQKIESIYKKILELYSENIPDNINIKLDGNSSTNILTFASPCGGVGNSTVAAACAKYFAGRNQNALYLNLERLGSSDMFFSGSGDTGFSDVIFALKSKRSNFSLKLESSVKRDSSGVCFYSTSNTPLDMEELTGEETKRLVSSLLLAGVYDMIVIDMAFDLSEKAIEVLGRSTKIIFVSDGSEISNIKMRQAIAAFEVLEKQQHISLLDQTAVLYNKFRSKTGEVSEDIGLQMLGGAPLFEQASATDIVSQLQQLEIFKKF